MGLKYGSLETYSFIIRGPEQKLLANEFIKRMVVVF